MSALTVHEVGQTVDELGDVSCHHIILFQFNQYVLVACSMEQGTFDILVVTDLLAKAFETLASYT